MFYRLLGMAVWHGGKLVLRRRYRLYLPTKVVAGAAVTVIGGIALLVARRNASAD
jgi:hypothetical protein